RIEQTGGLEQHRHGGGLATGQHHRVHAGQVLGRPHLDRVDVEGAQDLSVGGDRSLQGDDADLGHLGGPSARTPVYGGVAVGAVVVWCGIVSSSVVDVVDTGSSVVVVAGRVVGGRERVVVAWVTVGAGAVEV